MKNILILILISFFISCDTQDDITSFANIDVTESNNEIIEGIRKCEDWVKTPLLITNRLVGPSYNSEGHGTYIIEQYEKDNSLTIIVTNEGLLDDCVYGEKRIIDFKYTNKAWIITKIKLGFKCYEYRGGHSNYSGVGCP